jgi:Putative Ig domain.
MRFTRLLLLLSLIGLIVVPVALALRFTDASYHPPVGETGKPYSWSFTGAAGCGPALPYQYKVLNGSPPPGLTLDSSGLVHGIPTQAGDYSFWVQLSDQNPPSASWCVPRTAQREFTFKIIEGLRIVQSQSTLGPGFVNQPFSLQFTATGGGTQTWSIVANYGSGPPTGLTLSPTGLLSGTPTSKGTYTFRVQVTDQTRTDVQTYTFPIVDKLLVTRPDVPAGEVGRPYKMTAVATGGQDAHTWSLTSGNLPAGLTLDPATGVVSGTPTTVGVFPVELTATDTIGQQASTDVKVAIAAKLAALGRTAPRASLGRAYRFRLTARGGVAPRTWRIVGRRRAVLPAGLALNTRTGVISGTPRQAGTFRLRAQVTDKLRAHAVSNIVLKVAGA